MGVAYGKFGSKTEKERSFKNFFENFNKVRQINDLHYLKIDKKKVKRKPSIAMSVTPGGADHVTKILSSVAESKNSGASGAVRK